jgi:hypothetical protein
MTQDLTQSYRGVLCASCRQPIPVPAIVVTMEAEAHEEERHVRVFNVRCRACEKELPYRSTDIVEYQGAPRTRHHARLKPAIVHPSHHLGRAAHA